MTGKELKYEIINRIGVIPTSAGSWNTGLNRVSWNGFELRYDLRSWSPDYSKMGKGIIPSEEERTVLAEFLAKEVEFLKED